MSKVNTNAVSLRSAVQSAIGSVPTTGWRQHEPNEIGAYGAEITTTPRRPISNLRGRRKGGVTDLDSPVEFSGDLTMQSLHDFAEGFMFSEYANTEFSLRASSGTVPPPATTNAYTIDAASATLAGKIQWVTSSYGTLLYAKGYAIAANNGLKVVTADVASTNTSIAVTGQGVVAETPPVNATLEVAGVRILDDADLTLTVSGPTATLVSAAAITDWSTLGLRAGQWIHIGSATAAFALQNALGAAGTASYGFARITSISGATLNLDKLDANLSSASGAASLSQDILFGRFLRNVPVDADATDNRYKEVPYYMEVTYPDLGGAGTDEYEYAEDNLVNEVTFELPLSDKATVTWAFVGTSTLDITGSRISGPSSALVPLRTEAVGTASNIASITTDVVSSVSEVCFKDISLTIRNNVSPEKCLGTLGATFLNTGAFEVDLEGQMLFTNKAIVNAVKNNTTVTMALVLRNDDGGVAFDLPAMTFGGGGREFPVDASVLVNIEGQTFTDPTFGFDVGMSFFPVLPRR